MFQSTLLKRTMSLVVLSLLASAIIATLAFIVAGKTSTLQLEVENSLAQDAKYNEIFTANPELFESQEFRNYFFESSYATGHDYYLVNMNGDVLQCTSSEHRNMRANTTYEVLTQAYQFSYEDLNGMGFYIKELGFDGEILICRIPITEEPENLAGGWDTSMLISTKNITADSPISRKGSGEKSSMNLPKTAMSSRSAAAFAV